MTAAVQDGALPARRHRHWSDVAGSIAFVLLAVEMLVTAPKLSLALVPVFVYEVAFGIAFLIRGEARSTLHGWGARVAAYGGSFLVPAFLAFAARFAPAWIAPAGTAAPGMAHVLVPLGALMIAAGMLISAWGLWYLRASVSLVPAARALVTRGPYAFARHPLYSAYLVSYAGLLLQHPTPELTVGLGIWLACTLARMRYEESVLEGAFPDYADYRARVGAFAPRITSAV